MIQTSTTGPEYLTVGQAAALLGVSPGTLRNWDRSGRLKPVRHPHNGYRIYRRDDLLALIPESEAAGNVGQRLAPRFDWADVGETEHLVQFYDSDGFLMDAVAGYLEASLRGNESAMLIATGVHRGGIARRLSARGIDLDAAARAGRYVALDAAEALDKFMVDDMPDRARFLDTVGASIAEATRGGGRVRAFGEMVALLWADGNRQAAIRLEQLWNELAREHRFALFCAYPMDGFAGGEHGEGFEQVCTCHTRVIPSESYAALPEPQQRLREISRLQQRARSLEREIDQRQEAEEALRQSERRYRELMELLPAAVYTCEAPSGRIRYYNRRAAELWGREPEVGDQGELYCGSVRLRLLDGSVLPHEQCPMAQVLQGGPAVRDVEVVIERPDGTRIVAVVNIDPLHDACGRLVGAVNVFQDLTERHRVEEELRQAKAAADHASAAKDRFLAQLSHELRTPLTPVVLSIGALEADQTLPERVRQELAMIRENIDLETRLIDDLLDLSRSINGKMTLRRAELRLHGLIEHVVAMMRPEFQAAGQTLEIDLRATADWVNGDSRRLHQVLWNLLKNAIKFTPAGGRIAVLTRNDGASLQLEVRDDGIGIESAELEQIFNPFEQAAQSGDGSGGLGLGLAICRSVVELHGGRIEARSDGPGKGARFLIDLPAAGTSVDPGQAQRPATAPTAARALRILLVEDHADTLAMMQRILEKSGHAVTPAASVAEAAGAADAGSFDILLSDIGLPDGSGLDVVRAVHARQPDVPAVAMTGFGMDDDVRKTEAAGFAAHLTKPIDVKSLIATIRRLTGEAE